MKPKKQTDNLRDMILHYVQQPTMMLKEGEYITPDELYDAGMGICSNCGQMVLHDQFHCHNCGNYRLILREGTVMEIEESKKIVKQKVSIKTQSD